MSFGVSFVQLGDHQVASVQSPGMADLTDFPRLVGIQEVASILGVSTKRVHQLANEPASPADTSHCLDDVLDFIEPRRGPQLAFPTPIAELACGRIWLADDIESWKQATRPTTDPPPGAVPPRDPAMPHTDPWDADALRWLLDEERFQTFTATELLACLRRQPAMVKRNPERVDAARDLAWDCDVTVRTDPGGHTLHLFRLDPGRPTYPTSAAERRTWLRSACAVPAT